MGIRRMKMITNRIKDYDNSLGKMCVGGEGVGEQDKSWSEGG